MPSLKGSAVASEILDSNQPIDYSSSGVPSSYKCGKCRKQRLKLWCEPVLVDSRRALSCADCSAKMEDVDISAMNPDGLREGEHGVTDKIGDLIPALPTPENDAFWLYRAFPEDEYAWWKRLPLR